MSKQEQAALVAWVNSFRPTRRVTAFEQLADGRALMELLSNIDGTHFKAAPTRGPGAGPSSPDNWVLKTNALKRIHRLLISFPIPAPHHSLSTSSLPEPSLSSIVKSPTSSEGTAGLLQLLRMALCCAVWAPGNEKVIAKIQALGESNMAELMRSIEEIMASMPEEEFVEDEATGSEAVEDGFMSKLSRGSNSRSRSPQKRELSRPNSPPGALREERDKLSVENEQLRNKVEELKDSISELTVSLDEARSDKEDAMARLLSLRTGSQDLTLRSSLSGATDKNHRDDLIKAEENIARLESEVSGKEKDVRDLQKVIDSLQSEVTEAEKLKDQLDEYRHMKEKLQRSENVVEKYKKKLEESASALEEENALLLSSNSALEADSRKAGISKDIANTYRKQIEEMEKQNLDQATQVAELEIRLEAARSQLLETEKLYERDHEELQTYQEKVKEIELGGASPVKKGLASHSSGIDQLEGNLNDELDGLASTSETKTDLRMRIRQLEREISNLSQSTSPSKASTLEVLLKEAQKGKDKYQSDYLISYHDSLRYQAQLESIRSGKGSSSEISSALRIRIEELEEELKVLEKEVRAERRKVDRLETELREAKDDLDLINLDQKDMLASVKRSLNSESTRQKDQIEILKNQIEDLKDKDRLHLTDIRKLLMEKIEFQSNATGIPSENRTSDSRDLQDLSNENQLLKAEIERLKMTSTATNNEELDYPGFEEAQRSYEAQIISLKEQLHMMTEKQESSERRYRLENQLMLSAWQDLGSRVMKDHLNVIGQNVKRGQKRVAPGGWLGKQRRWQEDSLFSK